ncbi:MAG TPA: hypothetical protein EYG03_29365 [Planctomycetes bacterium]|nr:hypothetical protein [Fuerstiella sp.]HIK96073.1 hypothetical protein [Planctomycetota bacterium]
MTVESGSISKRQPASSKTLRAGDSTPMSKYLCPRFLAFPAFALVGQWFWMQNYSAVSAWACAFWIPVLTYC